MKKLGIICMILFFSMSAVGMGGADWHNLILTKFQAATGIVSAGLRNHGANDYGSDPCLPGGPNWENQDIGSTRCTDGPYMYELEEKSYSDNISVDIYGYQSYAPVITLEMANCGSIPIKADRITMDWDGDLAGNIQVGKWSIDCPDGYQKEGQGYKLLGEAIKYICLDPGQIMWLDLELRVGEKAERENTFKAVSEALGAALKTKTAMAAETNADYVEDETLNSTESSTNTSYVPSDDQQTIEEIPSDVPLYTLPEEPVSGATGSSEKIKIDEQPELVCGLATGKIAITYRCWNEQW